MIVQFGNSASRIPRSSSTTSSNPANAWVVDFGGGNLVNDDKPDGDYVRAVRGGSGA